MVQTIEGKAYTFNNNNCNLLKDYNHSHLTTSLSFKMKVSNQIGIGKNIAILTSGGDAPGMNAAIRAVVRTAITLGAVVYGVKWGYQGLVDGGDNIVKLDWSSVGNLNHKGGTVIGSARCADFRMRSGRLKAALNLIEKNIDGLVVIGGDGSLSGANLFRSEWPSYIEEFIEQGKIEKNCNLKHLNIVGLVGSIDNDFCGTEMTIGTDTALHRIIECTESIRTTAQSHQRAFVLEVMGRNSGYLGLIAGIGVAADYVFLPELAVSEDWQDVLARKLNKSKSIGKKFAIVIVSEGASTVTGQPIKSQEVVDAITEKVGFDTRLTVLGHVQRGGTTSAFDRILALRSGIEAAVTVLKSTPEDPSYVVCFKRNKIVNIPLLECIEALNKIKVAYKEKRHEDVITLRGESFTRNMNLFKLLRTVEPKFDVLCSPNDKTVGIICVGAVAAGTNSVIKSVTRNSVYNCFKVYGIMNGFGGLINGKYNELTWNCVEELVGMPGCILGTSRELPDIDFEAVSKKFEEMKLTSLVIIGGFEGLLAVKQLKDYSKIYKAFNIPTMLIPATMSNNVPCTYQTIGCDSTLNQAVKALDQLLFSGLSYNNRVYVVNVMGKRCGYLAILSALASASQIAYIFEEKYKIKDICQNVEFLKKKMDAREHKFCLIICSDACNPNYNKDFITSIINEEIEGIDARSMSLGHVQQGIPPSPFDRFFASKQGLIAVNYVKSCCDKLMSGESVPQEDMFIVLCSDVTNYKYRYVEEVIAAADIPNRKPKNQQYLKFNEAVKLFSGMPFKYTSEVYPDFTFEKIID